MLVPYSRIIGAPVYELKYQSRIGKIFELIYDAERLTLMAILLNKPILSNKSLAIAVNNISQITNDVIVMIDNEDSAEFLESLPRVDQAYNQGYCGIGQKVITKSGEYIGKVFDLLVDGDTFKIKKIYAKKLLSERIISTSSIIEYKNDRFVIKEDFESVKVRVQATAPSKA